MKRSESKENISEIETHI